MTIAEVSKKFGLSQDTLRYYERIRLVPSISRSKRGLEIIRKRTADGLNLSNA